MKRAGDIREFHSETKKKIHYLSKLCNSPGVRPKFQGLKPETVQPEIEKEENEDSPVKLSVLEQDLMKEKREAMELVSFYYLNCKLK
jgi:hypothetical protein